MKYTSDEEDLQERYRKVFENSSEKIAAMNDKNVKAILLNRNHFMRKKQDHFQDDLKRFLLMQNIVGDEICWMLNMANQTKICDSVKNWQVTFKVLYSLVVDYFIKQTKEMYHENKFFTGMGMYNHETESSEKLSHKRKKRKKMEGSKSHYETITSESEDDSKSVHSDKSNENPIVKLKKSGSKLDNILHEKGPVEDSLNTNPEKPKRKRRQNRAALFGTKNSVQSNQLDKYKTTGEKTQEQKEASGKGIEKEIDTGWIMSQSGTFKYLYGMRIYSKDGSILAVDDTAETTKVHELRKWISRQRELDRIENRFSMNSKNLWDMDADTKEQFYLEQSLRQSNLQAKLDYFMTLIDEKNQHEFEKIFDMDLILELGKRLTANMSEDWKDTSNLLHQLLAATTLIDDDDTQQKQLEELKKTNDIRRIVAMNDMKALDEASTALETYTPNFDLDQNNHDLMMTFKKYHKKIAVKAIQKYRDQYYGKLTEKCSQTEMTSESFEQKIQNGIDEVINIRIADSKSKINRLQKSYEDADKRSVIFERELEECKAELQEYRKEATKEIKDAEQTIQELDKEVKYLNQNSKYDQVKIGDQEYVKATALEFSSNIGKRFAKFFRLFDKNILLKIVEIEKNLGIQESFLSTSDLKNLRHGVNEFQAFVEQSEVGNIDEVRLLCVDLMIKARETGNYDSYDANMFNIEDAKQKKLKAKKINEKEIIATPRNQNNNVTKSVNPTNIKKDPKIKKQDPVISKAVTKAMGPALGALKVKDKFKSLLARKSTTEETKPKATDSISKFLANKIAPKVQANNSNANSQRNNTTKDNQDVPEKQAVVNNTASIAKFLTRKATNVNTDTKAEVVEDNWDSRVRNNMSQNINKKISQGNKNTEINIFQPTGEKQRERRRSRKPDDNTPKMRKSPLKSSRRRKSSVAGVSVVSLSSSDTFKQSENLDKFMKSTKKANKNLSVPTKTNRRVSNSTEKRSDNGKIENNASNTKTTVKTETKIKKILVKQQNIKPDGLEASTQTEDEEMEKSSKLFKKRKDPYSCITDTKKQGFISRPKDNTYDSKKTKPGNLDEIKVQSSGLNNRIGKPEKKYQMLDYAQFLKEAKKLNEIWSSSKLRKGVFNKIISYISDHEIQEEYIERFSEIFDQIILHKVKNKIPFDINLSQSTIESKNYLKYKNYDTLLKEQEVLSDKKMLLQNKPKYEVKIGNKETLYTMDFDKNTEVMDTVYENVNDKFIPTMNNTFYSKDVKSQKRLHKTSQSWNPACRNKNALKNIVNIDNYKQTHNNENAGVEKGVTEIKELYTVPDELVKVWAKQTPDQFFRSFDNKFNYTRPSKSEMHNRYAIKDHDKNKKKNISYLQSLNKNNNQITKSMHDFTKLDIHNEKLRTEDFAKNDTPYRISTYHGKISHSQSTNNLLKPDQKELDGNKSLSPKVTKESKINNSYNPFFNNQGQKENFIRGLFETFKQKIQKSKQMKEELNDYNRDLSPNKKDELIFVDFKTLIISFYMNHKACGIDCQHLYQFYNDFGIIECFTQEKKDCVREDS